MRLKLSDKLYIARYSCNMSLRKLSELTEIDIFKLSDFENDKKTPTKKEKKILFEVLNIMK